MKIVLKLDLLKNDNDLDLLRNVNILRDSINIREITLCQTNTFGQ